jgi:PAS domain S-box-containing protein
MDDRGARLERAQYRLGLIAERYALATSAADVGVWNWNLQTGVFHLDPNIKGFLGYQDGEIPNDIEVWASYIHPDDKDAVMKAAQDTITGRAAEYAFEHRMLHKDGSVRWFMVRGRAIRDHRGRAIRFVGNHSRSHCRGVLVVCSCPIPG